MESILEALYSGRIRPYERAVPQRISEAKAAFLQKQEAFYAKLEDNLKEEFTALLEEQANLFLMDDGEQFIYGFKLGARLMCETFEDSELCHKL